MKASSTKSVTIPEKTVEQNILQYLATIKDCFAWKNHTVGVFDPKKKVFRMPRNRFQIRGVSDILGIYKGRPLAIEVKSAKGKVSPEQKDFLNKFAEMGGLCFVARSVEDVINEFKKHDSA